MLSDDDKKSIIERIEFEEKIRKEISPSKDETITIWARLNSNIGILLITSLITSLLVPLWQNNQHNYDWQRQIKADNLKYRLEMMHKFLEDFAADGALTSEAYERIRPYLRMHGINKPDFERFHNQFIDLQNRRFRQNAKLLALVVYFSDKEQVGKPLKKYIDSSSLYMRSIEEFIVSDYKAFNENDEGGFEQEQSELVSNVNKQDDVIKAYGKMVDVVGRCVSDEEQLYEKFRF